MISLVLSAQPIHRFELIERSPGPSVHVSDDSYLGVTREQLTKWQRGYAKELARKGVVPDKRFDCTKFVSYYVAYAQLDHYKRHWHGGPIAAAVGEVWYRSSSGVIHAVVIAQGPEGLLFWEPQTGKSVVLSADELRSISFVRY